MALIELSASMEGTSEASAEGRMLMSLQATLRGVSGSLGQKPVESEPEPEPFEKD